MALLEITDEDYHFFSEEAKKLNQDVIERGYGWNLGWRRSKQFQVYNFIINKLNLEGKRVLDIGCGYGDFGGFLGIKKIEAAKYTGIESSSELVEMGNTHYPELDIRHIIWPKLSEKEFADINQNYDIAVIISYANLFEPEKAAKFVAAACPLVTECVICDWLPRIVPKVYPLLIEGLQGICSSIELIGRFNEKDTVNREWTLIRR